jgi:integrase/recombinase XerD
MWIVQRFRNHLERLGYSKGSCQMLPDCVKAFLEFTAKPLATITPLDIVNFREHLQERPNKRRPGALSESFINHHIYSLKLFFGWQIERGDLLENPMSSLEFPTPNHKPRTILTQVEIKALYAVTESFKERAVLSLFYGCGLRRTEAERLNLKDLYFRSNLLYVRAGKGDKRRVVPLSEKVKEDLKNYAFYERKPNRDQEAFIINATGTRTTGNTFNRLLKRLLVRTDIDKQISLHSLRHSIATHLLEGGLSVEYVRDFLGHKHLESTQIYTRVNNSQLYEL